MYRDLLDINYPFAEIEEEFNEPVLRAAQFAPFSALNGHEEAIDETARLTQMRVLQDVSVKEELDRKLQYLTSVIHQSPLVTVTYFVPDLRKEGGRYETVCGNLKKVRETERELVLSGDFVISVDDILYLEPNESESIP